VEVLSIRPEAGSTAALATIRRHERSLRMGEHVADIEPLVKAIRDGEFDERTTDGTGRAGRETTGGEVDVDGA